MCFNTQPPEGGWETRFFCSRRLSVSTHSRPKAAGLCLQADRPIPLFQHTAARRRLDYCIKHNELFDEFQHTAARRRLGLVYHCFKNPSSFNTQPPEGGWLIMIGQSTISRCFNTQPPEGGWVQASCKQPYLAQFQHTAARRRLANHDRNPNPARRFNTQPPEGGWFFGNTQAIT